MTTHDVIIVGAGSVGIPTALSMAQAGLDVLVLDQAASPGQGAHKSAIGGVRATHSDPAKIRLCQRSLEIFSTWQARHGDDIQWASGGYVFVAYRDYDVDLLQDLLTTQHRLGLNNRWLGPGELLEVVPGLNPVGLRGGTYSPEDGHCSTLLAGHASYKAAQRAGATFRFGEPVAAILTTAGHVTGVQTPVSTYHAPVVINAAGAQARAVGALVNDPHPVAPESHEAGITEPVRPFVKPLIVDIRPAPGSSNCYFYQLTNGQVVFCLTPDPPIPGTDRSETSAFLPQIARRLVDLMPKLAALRVRRTWRGLYPMTPDGVPLVGWSREVTGYLAAVGMCGQGFMLGPGLGELLTRMVTQSLLSPTDQETLDALSPYRRFAGGEALK